MFIIFGFGKRKGEETIIYDKSGKRYTIFYVANCFSLFFIPIINTSKVFFISCNGKDMEITKDEYNEMKSSGYVLSKFENMSFHQSDFQQAYEAAASSTSNAEGTEYANDICPVCKNKLERSFAFCPYCGQKQPRA